MFRSLSVLIVILVLGNASARAGESTLAAVKKRLAELKGDGATIKLIDPKATAALPGAAFVAAYFPQFPVARVPPEPLAAQNLFLVDKAGQVTLLSSLGALEKTFMTRAGAVTEPAPAAAAFAHLAEVFFQDGFFKFELDRKSIQMEEKMVGGAKVQAVSAQVNVVPEAGNKGFFRFDLVLGEDGKITRIMVLGKVMAGVRPRCQATRLLDADPVIREICERDLLVMGRLAEGYLREQRARAAPELQRAIDRVWRRIVDEGR